VIRVVRPALTWFLLIAGPLLSFDALLHRALDSGIISGPLTILGVYTISPHSLAGVWAMVIEVLLWAGVLGVKADPHDWRAWATGALGLGLSLVFQAAMLDTWLARGMATVPALATASALIIFEVPRRYPTVPDEIDEPVVPLGPEPTPTVEPTAEPATVAPAEGPATVGAATVLTDADRQAIRRVQGDPAALERIITRRRLHRPTVDAWVNGRPRSGDQHNGKVPV
jgi:hypothetical protein